MSETLAERQKNNQLSDGGNVWRELGGEIRCRSVSRHISSSGNFGQHAVLSVAVDASSNRGKIGSLRKCPKSIQIETQI
jgi:hypothetical protein